MRSLLSACVRLPFLSWQRQLLAPSSRVQLHAIGSKVNMTLKPEIITFSPSFRDQEPGTSGLRRKVKIFKQNHYTESFIQSILNSLGPELVGSKLVVGGDGRYYVKEAAELIIKICAANGVR